MIFLNSKTVTVNSFNKFQLINYVSVSIVALILQPTALISICNQRSQLTALTTKFTIRTSQHRRLKRIYLTIFSKNENNEKKLIKILK